MKERELFVIATGTVPKDKYQDGQGELALGIDVFFEKPSDLFVAEETGAVKESKQYITATAVVPSSLYEQGQDEQVKGVEFVIIDDY